MCVCLYVRTYVCIQAGRQAGRHAGRRSADANKEATHSNTKSSMPSTDCQEPCREQIKWVPQCCIKHQLYRSTAHNRFCRLARGDQIIAFIPEISTPKPRNPYNIIQTRPQRRRGRASGTQGCRAPRRLPPGSVTVPIRRGVSGVLNRVTRISWSWYHFRKSLP